MMFIDKLKNMKKEEVLAFLFALYLILGLHVPEPFASAIDSMLGKIIVITLAIILFTNTGAVLGILGFLVAFDLIRRSSFSTGSVYALGEDFKMERITSYNQQPYTLEQEIVSKMAPLSRPNIIQSVGSSYVPLTEDDHGATAL
jgi:hypothetical protein